MAWRLGKGEGTGIVSGRGRKGGKGEKRGRWMGRGTSRNSLRRRWGQGGAWTSPMLLERAWAGQTPNEQDHPAATPRAHNAQGKRSHTRSHARPGKRERSNLHPNAAGELIHVNAEARWCNPPGQLTSKPGHLKLAGRPALLYFYPILTPQLYEPLELSKENWANAIFFGRTRCERAKKRNQTHAVVLKRGGGNG